MHLDTGTDLAVLQQAIRTDAAVGADPHAAFDDEIDVQRHVTLALQHTADVDAGRVHHGDAGTHQGFREATLVIPLQFRELDTVVDAGDLFQAFGMRRRDTDAVVGGEADHVRQIIFPLHVIVTDAPEPVFEPRPLRNDEAGIDLGDAELGLARVLLLDDAQHLTPLVAYHASVAGRIGQGHGQDAERGVRAVVDETV